MSSRMLSQSFSPYQQGWLSNCGHYPNHWPGSSKPFLASCYAFQLTLWWWNINEDFARNMEHNAGTPSGPGPLMVLWVLCLSTWRKTLKLRGLPSQGRPKVDRVSGTSETADIFRSSTFDQVLLAVYGKLSSFVGLARLCHPPSLLQSASVNYSTSLLVRDLSGWPKWLWWRPHGQKKSPATRYQVLLAAPIFLGDNEDFVDELSLDLPGCIWLFRPACSHKTSDFEMP